MPKKITRLRRTIFQGGMYASRLYFCSSRERSVFYVFILTPGVGVLVVPRYCLTKAKTELDFAFLLTACTTDTFFGARQQRNS